MRVKRFLITAVLLLAVLPLTAFALTKGAPAVTIQTSDVVSKSEDISGQSSGAVTVIQRATPQVNDANPTTSDVTADGQPVHKIQLSEVNIIDIIELNLEDSDDVGVQATYPVNFNLPGSSLATISDGSGNPWYLTRNEEVTISLTWLPRDATLRVGLIDSDNTFFYVNFTDGADSRTFVVNVADNYRVGIYNTDTHEVTVTGNITI